MGRTLTNNFSLQVAIEDSIGVLPGSPSWKLLEPNAINTFGAEITTVPRNPISKSRQRRKGTITDLDSSVEFDSDLTMDVFIDFIEGFCFANFSGPISTSTTEATASAFVVPAMDEAIAEGTLVVTRAFANAGNNGTHVVDAAGTTTSVPVTTVGLVAETPASTRNTTLEIAGFRFAAGDLAVNSDGNLTTVIKDLTTLNLEPGQALHVGGLVAANRFDETANFSYARVVSIAAGLIVLDKKYTTFVTDDGGTQAVDLLFGRFLKNVAVDDANYLERSFQFEGAYQDLGNPSGDEYEYSIGNFCNTLGFELPLTDKATTSFAFTGTNTEDIVAVGDRKTNADAPLVPVQTTAFNTSSDIARLRITEVDETGLTTDFKSLTVNINNNVSPEKVLGVLGARYMNAGNFEIDLESQLLFSNSDVITAIKANDTLTMDFAISNDNEAMFVDIPSMTLGGGDREYPVNESILVNTTAQAFEDTTYGASLMISLFPLPPAKS